VAFLEGRLLSIQSEQSEKFSKISDWLKKSHFCFDYVNRLMVIHSFISIQKWLFWRASFYPANQSNLKFSKSPDWLEKSRPSKKAIFVLIM